MDFSRRTFITTSLASIAPLAGTLDLAAQPAAPPLSTMPRIGVIDTNIHLFEWPSRHLPYSHTSALVAKLRRHGVRQAWAGTFEALLAKDIAGVNARLAEECRREGSDFLVPVGSVNPRWPGWEEDLRRCHEAHGMRALRLYPGYHGYTLAAPEFAALLQQASARGLLVQIALEMEDPRVQHPQQKAPTISPAPLLDVFKKVPAARVQLLNSWQWARVPANRALLSLEQVTHDISGLDGVGSIGHALAGDNPSLGAKVAPERLLFGSHAPLFPIEAMLLRMLEAQLPLAHMQAIMETNSQRVLAPV